jgi:hypothetical protein
MSWRTAQGVLSYFCLGLGAIITGLPAARAQNFQDIQGHWAQTCISNLAEQGIVAGYPNNTFRPGEIITRAEYAAIMNQAFPEVAVQRSAKNFTDVSADYWGQEAIQTAYRKGFLSGYPNNEFRPEDLIVREEAFVSLASGLDYDLPDNAAQILNATYEDAGEISDYAEGQIAAATEQNILISPPKPQFEQRLMGPSDPATRGQIAAALCQAKGIPGVPSQYVVSARTSPPNSQPEPGNEVTLGQTCTNEAVGYTVDYPVGWQTNARSDLRGIPDDIDKSPSQIVEPCSVFDSGEIEIEYATEDFDEAVYFDLENIPFNELVNLESRSTETLSRRETTVDGRQAVVVEKEGTGIGLLPEGRRFYSYYIDYGDQTLKVTTYNVPNQPYATNKQIIDQMMNNIEIQASVAG